MHVFTLGERPRPLLLCAQPRSLLRGARQRWATVGDTVPRAASLLPRVLRAASLNLCSITSRTNTMCSRGGDKPLTTHAVEQVAKTLTLALSTKGNTSVTTRMFISITATTIAIIAIIRQILCHDLRNSRSSTASCLRHSVLDVFFRLAALLRGFDIDVLLLLCLVGSRVDHALLLMSLQADSSDQGRCQQSAFRYATKWM